MRHRFFVTADQIRDGEITFTDEQAHQIRNVLRLGAGDQIRVFDGLLPHDLVVELITPKVGRVVGERTHAAESRTRLCVFPALLQRDKFETVLQKLTEVGASAITPVISERALIREAPDAKRITRWRSILREAAEQSGRGVVPELRPTLPFQAAIAAAEGACILAYERERDHQLWDALAQQPEVVSLFVGPEGGFSDQEAECAKRVGAQLITLGQRVLRSETASPILTALVLYELARARIDSHKTRNTA